MFDHYKIRKNELILHLYFNWDYYAAVESRVPILLGLSREDILGSLERRYTGKTQY